MVNTHLTELPSTDSQHTVTELLQNVSLDSECGLVAQIYQVLWGLIITCRLMPGQLISEKDIAKSLKASKTPVREALIRLEDAGLVIVVPKSGTYVTSIRINTYIEACFTRLQLEAGAVHRAAERHHDKRRQDLLDSIVEQQEAAMGADNCKSFFELDEQLHKTFFVMAGVPGVWDVVKRTQSEVYRVRHLKRAFNISGQSTVLEDHRAIVEAIRQGDAAAARSALVKHIGTLEGELQELSCLPELLEFIDAFGHVKGRTRSPRNTRSF